MKEEDILGENHIATSAETPLRVDAFEKSEAEKITEIEGHVRAILHTLGMDLTDDSLKGTPKRVAKMFVKEIFGGLLPERRPSMSTFNNSYHYGEMLVEKNIVSKVQLETAKANLQRAQAAYNEVASNIGFAVVKAPVNGIVGAINYREGALVTANNTVLTTVSDIKEVYAYFSMNEKEYLDFLNNTEGKNLPEKLKNLPEASLVLANGKEYTQKGKIQAVTGQIDPTTGSIQFRATFPNPEGVLTNGNSGTIRVPQHFSNSLVIPEVATFEQQGKVFAYKIIEKDSVVQTVITLKNRADNYAVVESGLSKGDTILVQGLNAVRRGMHVKPEPIVQMDSIVKRIQPIFNHH